MTLHDQFVALSLVNDSDVSFVGNLCTSYAQAITEKVYALGSELPAASIPSLQLLAEQASGARCRCWNGSMAYAHELHRRGAGGAASALLQLILSYAELGLEGEYAIDLPYADWFLFESNRIQCVGRVTVSARAGTVKIASSEETATYQLVDGVWCKGGETDPCVAWSDNELFLLCSGYRVDPAVILAEDVALDSTLIPAAHRSINQAIGHLHEAGPDFVSWSARLIAQLTMVSSNGGSRLSSRSLSVRTGNVEIAVPGNTQHLAELLVHEAAHQHFYLAQLYAPMVAPQAAHLRFYSAINGRQRGLDRVALAYHAIINIYSLLDALYLGGSDISESSRRRMDELAGTEKSLRETLEQNDDKLTSFGQAFCRSMTAAGRDLIGNRQVQPFDAPAGQIRGVA